MAKKARYYAGGYVYHALNRAAGHIAWFRGTADYAAFGWLLLESLASPTPARYVANY
jgi:hypothetical protein